MYLEPAGFGTKCTAAVQRVAGPLSSASFGGRRLPKAGMHEVICRSGWTKHRQTLAAQQPPVVNRTYVGNCPTNSSLNYVPITCKVKCAPSFSTRSRVVHTLALTTVCTAASFERTRVDYCTTVDVLCCSCGVYCYKQPACLHEVFVRACVTKPPKNSTCQD